MDAPSAAFRPRILFISTAKTIGGGEIYLANLLPALRSKYDCTVLGRPPLLKMVSNSADVENIRLFPACLEKILKRSYRIKKAYYQIYFRRYFNKNSYELVNLQEFDGAFVEAIDFKPIIITEQTRLFVPSNRKVWARYLFKKIDRVLCVSRQTMADVLALGLQPSKCVIVHNGVDINKFKPSSEIGDYVTWIGRFEEVDKNPMLFVKIAEAAQAKGRLYKFRMVGDGEAMNKVRVYIKDHKIKNLELTGSKLPAEMFDIYRQASLLCMTSKQEGLPFVVLEAMACGKPVVASNVGGLPDIIDNPRVGRLIEEFDESGFLEAISSVLEDPKLYQSMSKAARVRIEDSFSMNRQVEQTIHQYEAALKDQNG